MEEIIISNTRAIILAAGRSTRFKTDKSKLIYSICGQPMILYPIRMLQELKIPICLTYQPDKNFFREDRVILFFSLVVGFLT